MAGEARRLRLLSGQALERWYHGELCQAFPENERKPLSDIRAMVAAGRYQVWGLLDGEALLGYATLWMEPADKSCILLDYLGVTASRRGGGLGGEILERLLRQLGNQTLLIIEAECPVEGDDPAENSVRLRRIAFYQRCGFHMAYQMATCGMRFQVLLSALPPVLEPVMAAHRAIYGPRRTDVMVPLAAGEKPPEPPYWLRER